MTLVTDLLTDVFTRLRDDLAAALDGLDEPALRWRPDPDANPVGWLGWHLARVQDDHLAGLGGREQVWTARGWAERFDLPYAVSEHGFGHSREQVDAWRGSAADIVGYHADVTALTLEVLAGLDDAVYAAVVDDSWDPPVTAGVRMVSVVDEVNQHLGQVAYLRGMLDRRAGAGAD